jgi:hypothetical protein
MGLPTSYSYDASDTYSKALVRAEIYCQSKQIDNRPSPSFPLEPPKIRVKSADR